MKRVAWLTDIHLNFLLPGQVGSFLQQVAALRADAIVISGDLTEGRDVSPVLRQFAEQLTCPVYFVLGNHDFYYSSISSVREQMAIACRGWGKLRYLTQSDVWELAPATGLVGHDGWADARLGDYERSYVMMNDYKLIAELSRVDKLRRWPILKSLGDDAAAHIRRVLPLALDKYPQVVLATHVPPFREACWHQGQLSDNQWLPHFTCKAAGEAILEIMRDYPNQRLTVLCGHTHGRGEASPLPNVTVLTGGAQYGAPEIQRVFEFE